MSGATFTASAYGPVIPSWYVLTGTADINGDGKPDLVLYNPLQQRTAIWYLNGTAYAGSAYGPTIPEGWTLFAP
jgi:hypothetical protein